MIDSELALKSGSISGLVERREENLESLKISRTLFTRYNRAGGLEKLVNR